MRYLYIIIFLILTALACKEKAIIIPEISDTLEHKSIYSIHYDENLIKTIPYEDKLFFIFKDGKILRFNLQKSITDGEYKCIYGISSNIRVFNNIVLFGNSDNLYLFDLNKMNIILEFNNITSNSIKHIANHYIFYEKDSKLIAYDYLRKRDIGFLPPIGNSEANYFNIDKELIICFDNKIYKYNFKTNYSNILFLKFKGNGKYLLDNNFLYLCTENREFIKYSIDKKKIKWKNILPANLAHNPIKFGNYIFLVLKNYNIYIYNKNGTLLWWDKLGTTPFLSPISMKENIGIALLPKKSPTIKFFNLDKKSVKYKLDTSLSDYFTYKNYVYAIHKDLETNNIDIIKISNIYTIDIKTIPEEFLTIDKSVEFKLLPVNLIKPKYSIKIEDNENNILFSDKFDSKDKKSFVWFPQQEGDFKLKLEVSAENKKNLEIVKPIKIINFIKLQNTFYYNIFKHCNNSNDGN